MEIDKNEFPKGNNLTPKKIERFLRFKFLRQISKQINFTLKAESQNEKNNKQKENKNIDKNFMYFDNDSEFNLSINSKNEKN